MTPIEEAEQLVRSFMPHAKLIENIFDWQQLVGWKTYIESAKSAALITVEKLIDESREYISVSRFKYWRDVKKEINKL